MWPQEVQKYLLVTHIHGEADKQEMSTWMRSEMRRSKLLCGVRLRIYTHVASIISIISERPQNGTPPNGTIMVPRSLQASKHSRVELLPRTTAWWCPVRASWELPYNNSCVVQACSCKLGVTLPGPTVVVLYRNCCSHYSYQVTFKLYYNTGWFTMQNPVFKKKKHSEAHAVFGR